MRCHLSDIVAVRVTAMQYNQGCVGGGHWGAQLKSPRTVATAGGMASTRMEALT